MRDLRSRLRRHDRESRRHSLIQRFCTETSTDNDAFNEVGNHADPATKEALRYRTALNEGFQMLEKRPISTSMAVEMCRTIKGVEMDIRSTPGTALLNDATGKIIYTPPRGQ